MMCACASATKSERLNRRRIRQPENPSRARFEPTKKEPGSLVLTPDGWVEIGEDGGVKPLNEEVS